MSISPRQVAAYLKEYIKKYRKEFDRLTSPPPTGGGYPKLHISPYLYSKEITCSLANDGAIITDFSWAPFEGWDIAGGPALLVDTPETRVPFSIKKLLADRGLLGKNIGIYRIVDQNGITDDIWEGRLPKISKKVEESIDDTKINVVSYNTSLEDLIRRYTYGAFCGIIDIKLQEQKADFWNPHIIRDLGFVTADRKYKTFYHYFEIIRHLENSAWDSRSIWTRVYLDVRRDFVHSIASDNSPGGYFNIGGNQVDLKEYDLFYDRLSILQDTIDKFEKLLEEQEKSEESVFHNFLQSNPIILDVYGDAISKPRFRYPKGESPLDKSYVEPDFIIKYPGNKYKLVELERPGKKMATKQGQPRSEVNQAAFQLTEWEHFIRNYYYKIKDKFPGISNNRTSMLIISRSTAQNFGLESRNINTYMDIANLHFKADEILTYDDLITRAKQAYIKLSGLL